MVWHGTRLNPPEKIYSSEEGFDLRFSSAGMWGKAIYFAESAQYSNSYAHNKGDKKQIFLARVIIGNSIDMPSDNTLIHPPLALDGQMYDSVTGDTNGSKVYMVYSNSKAYPEYLITYRAQ